MLEWCFSLSELNHNSHVELEPTVGLAIENPVDATPEQGMKLAYFVNMVSKINPKHLGYNIVHPTPIETLLQQYRRLIDSVLFNPMLKEKNINNLDELLQYMADDADFAKIVFYHFNDFLYCGNGVHELKIMYDGTLVGC